MKILSGLALGLSGLFLIAYVLGGGVGALAMAVVTAGLGMLGFLK